MNLLFRVLYAAHCKSTHHKLAMDSLRFLSCPEVENWRRLFLKHHVPFLQGAKEPDVKFKDFQNHVVHVEQNYWGGAAKSAELWYGRAVQQLRRGDWVNGIYAVGILSHYYTDPIQPFHTGQSVAEQNIHRAAEWSITKSYADIWAIAEGECGFPDVTIPDSSQWLTDMVHAGADIAHVYYDELIAHYDFKAGAKNPPKGWDDHSRRVLAKLIAYAVVGFSRVLGRLIRDANVAPPAVNLSFETMLSTISIPVSFITKQFTDRREQAQIRAMFEEYQRTGRVQETLAEDERVMQRLIAERDGTLSDSEPTSYVSAVSTRQSWSGIETTPSPSMKADTLASAVTATAAQDVITATEPEFVQKPAHDMSSTQAAVSPLKAEPSAAESPARTYLSLESDIVDAPSIGPKMAERFYALGMKQVRDLLDADPETACQALEIKQLTPELFRVWQTQAQLCCDIAGLRGHDSQILVACGYRTVDAVAFADPNALLKAATAIVASPAGQRVLRGSSPPDAAEVERWIASSKSSLQRQRAAA